jgi:tetratricopeptide (TPR) repeat protein
MKKLIIICAGLILFFNSSAQYSDLNDQENKDMVKVSKFIEKKNYDDAIKLMEPIVMNHKKNKAYWTELCQLYGAKYNSTKLVFTITTDGKDEESVKLVNDMKTLLNGAKEQKKYIDIMRKATLMCGDLEIVGAMLRVEVIDSRHLVDTDISEKGKKYFKMAESYFGQRDMVNAIKYYKKALDSDPNYYKAYLYLGDAYYLNKEYEEAEAIFQECSDSFPDLIEPIKYYYDAMYKQNDYKKAYEVALRGLMVYPDIGMQLKFETVCTQLDKSYKQHWMSRNYFPNKIKSKNSKIETAPWKYYREAFDSIKPYADTLTGVLRPNPITKAHYMEEYCWSYMLDKADKSKFEFARQMKEKDMLDCYVLFSLFHVDVYDQYKDLSKTNPQKLKKYIEQELVGK